MNDLRQREKLPAGDLPQARERPGQLVCVRVPGNERARLRPLFPAVAAVEKLSEENIGDHAPVFHDGHGDLGQPTVTAIFFLFLRHLQFAQRGAVAGHAARQPARRTLNLRAEFRLIAGGIDFNGGLVHQAEFNAHALVQVIQKRGKLLQFLLREHCVPPAVVFRHYIMILRETEDFPFIRHHFLCTELPPADTLKTEKAKEEDGVS